MGWIIEAILSALLKFLGARLDERDDDQTHERAAKAEASSETQEAIKDVSDARSTLPDAPDDADALAGELRRRKTGSRNFGNPGTPDKGSPQG